MPQHGQRRNRSPHLLRCHFQVLLQFLQVSVPGDFLYDPKRNARVRHLRQGSPPETMRTHPLKPHLLARLTQYPGGGFRVDMPPAMPARKQKTVTVIRRVLHEQTAQFLNHGHCPGGQLALGVVPAEDNLPPHAHPFIVDIQGVQGTGFINAAGRIQAHPEQSVVTLGLKPFSEKELYFFLRKKFRFPMPVDFHSLCACAVLHRLHQLGA